MINLTDFERKLVQIVRNRKIMGKEVTISILSKLMNRSKQEIRETVNKLKEKNIL
ncbi:hypothetical protein [Shouchella miscanthi]|uniref:Uncharacterized protein n=1 Tax=Shouchella miscanthi TaxID=2598861 RepID=A0ABU6NL58_9BACI|nr:hypothetical protein [Shouchella miscanthi]